MSLKIDKKIILKSAVHVAERDGFLTLTREKIAEHAKVSEGKVSNAYGSMLQLKRAVMRQAIHNNIYSIIIAGIVSKDPTAMKMSDEDRQRVLSEAL